MEGDTAVLVLATAGDLDERATDFPDLLQVYEKKSSVVTGWNVERAG